MSRTEVRHAEVTVAVMAKSPVPGRVKTRLCPPCSPSQAADIAAAALLDTLDAVAATDVARRVLVLEGDVGPWLPSGIEVLAQRGDGLDERLAAAVADLGGPLVIIGMDTPQVTAGLLEAAASALMTDDTDAVLGPASDGGYWLIGLRSNRPDALLGVPMSVGHTCAAQMERLHRLGLRTSIIDELCDVDTFVDALQVAGAQPGGRFAAAVAEVQADVSNTTGSPTATTPGATTPT
jgi:rSAM/selenodomain-associated transferase 1